MKGAAIRKTVTLPPSFWQAVDRYRVQQCLSTETEAIRQLMLIALRSVGEIELSPADVTRR